MKRIKSLEYLLLSFFLFFFLGCDKDGEEITMSYYSYTFTFFYPQNVNQNYRFVFNGKEGENGIVSTKNPNGILEIYDKNSNVEVYKGEITLSRENSNIQLIKLGNDIRIYDAKDYITFTPSFIFSGSGKYHIYFNNQPIDNNVINYLPKEQTTGKFQIYQEGNTTPIFVSNESVTISDGMIYSALQVGNDFINIPKDEEPEPTDRNTAKVRFIYTGDNVLNMDKITLKLYRSDETWNWSSPLPITIELELEKGKLSQYVLFDIPNVFANYYMYSIESEGKTIVPVSYSDMDKMVNIPLLSPDASQLIYKKATLLITNEGNKMELLTGLSEKW